MAVFFHKFLPQHALSRLGGWIAHLEIKWYKNWVIRWFIKRYNVNMDEAKLSSPEDYPHFDAFFTRELKKDVREICQSGFACPADGALSQFGRVTEGELIQAKGSTFSLEKLLGDQSDLSEKFSDAHFATIYLSPRDYHRVHMPLAGKLTSMVYVPGRLFSVNSLSVQQVPQLFARNERVISVFDTDEGPIALVLVGAMLVASIETVWAGMVTPQANRKVQRCDYLDQEICLQKGKEMGRFQFGSTVIALFPTSKFHWVDGLQLEKQLRLGQALATIQDSYGNI